MKDSTLPQRRGTALRRAPGQKEESKALADDFEKPLGTPQFNLGEENDDFELGRRPVGAVVKKQASLTMVKETQEAEEEDGVIHPVKKSKKAAASDDLKLEVKRHQRSKSEMTHSNNSSLDEDEVVIDADD